MKSSFSQSFTHQLEKLAPGFVTSRGLLLPAKEMDRSNILRFLLKSACQAQGSEAIKLGRSYLLSLPKSWLIQNIEREASECLDLDDDYEFERLIDLYELLSEDLADYSPRHSTISQMLSSLATRGSQSENPDVRELAEEVKSKIDFSENARRRLNRCSRSLRYSKGSISPLETCA